MTGYFQGDCNPVEKALFYHKGSPTGHLMRSEELAKFVPERILSSSLYILCTSEEEKVVAMARQAAGSWVREMGWTS